MNIKDRENAVGGSFGAGFREKNHYLVTGDGKITSLNDNIAMEVPSVYEKEEQKLLACNNDAELSVYDLSGAEATKTFINDRVIRIIGFLDDTKYYYYRVPGYDPFKKELYIYENGSSSLVSDGVFSMSDLYEDGTIMLRKNVDEDTSDFFEYTLEMYQNGESITIDDNVVFYNYKGLDDIYYIKDYNGYSGDMYHYKGKGDKVLLKENVSGFWTNSTYQRKIVRDTNFDF